MEIILSVYESNETTTTICKTNVHSIYDGNNVLRVCDVE